MVGIVQRIREALFPGSYDPDATMTAAQLGTPYVRRLTDDNIRDLDSITQDRAQEIAFYLYDRTPMGKRVTEIIRDYVVGEGITVTANGEDEAKRDKLQQAIDRHWNDGLNRMDLKLPQKVLEIGLFGEGCYPAFVNGVSGHVRWGYIDPSRIQKVVQDPQNAERKIAVILKPERVGESPKAYQVIAEDEDIGSKSFGRLVGPTGDGTDGIEFGGVRLPYEPVGVFLFQVNGLSNSSRGRPDLLANADYVDALDQLVFGEIDRAFLLKNFIWDVTYQGASDTDIRKYLQVEGAPQPGAVRGHNEKVTWEAVSPSLNAVDSQTFIDVVTSYIATGAGVSKVWINGTMDVNRNTSQEMGEPAFKHLTQRQRYVRYMVEMMVRFALDQFELHGQLDKRPSEQGLLPEPWAITVNAPELRQRDLASIAATFQTTMTAVIAALGEKIIDLDLGQEIAVLLIGMLGIDVDVKLLRERLEEQAKEEALISTTDPHSLDPLRNPALVDGVPGGNGNGSDGNGNGDDADARRLLRLVRRVATAQGAPTAAR